MRLRLLALFVVLAGVAVNGASAAITPRQAIADAVSRRLGVPASVVVSRIETSIAEEPDLQAVPAPDARLSHPSRFVLTAGGIRRGIAVATVTVIASYPRAARPIGRDQEIGHGDVDFSEGELPSVALRPLLSEVDIVGLKARRDIVAGETLTPAVLRVPPLVKSGDSVAITLRVGAVEVSGTGTASGSGQAGDMIRILQPHNPRVLKGRITGRGAVEIVQ